MYTVIAERFRIFDWTLFKFSGNSVGQIQYKSKLVCVYDF